MALGTWCPIVIANARSLMPHARYRGPPMTLANMRENDVRHASCATTKLMNVDARYDDRMRAVLVSV